MKKATKSAILAVLLAAAGSNAALADQFLAGTICAGAATLNNGSIVTVGQPFAGLTAAGDRSVSVQVGIVSALAGRAPLQINPAREFFNGQFQFALATQPGSNYVVQASTNLINWAPIWTNTATGTSLLFEDSQTSMFDRRFCRAITH